VSPPRVFSSASIECPLGLLLVVIGDDAVCATTFVGPSDVDAARATLGRALDGVVVADDHPLLHQARRQISAYFSGKRRAFTLPLELHGTPFQCRVWDALRHIPHGHTISYGEVARRIGRPTASRAVAQACGANPLPLFVPCHRVIASDGSLGGFSAGLPKKRRLLALEGHRTSALPLFSVAEHRAAALDRGALEDDVLSRLPEPLRAQLLSGEALEGGAQERLLMEAMSHLEPSDLAALASTLAQVASRDDSTSAAVMAEELLAILCARLLDRIPPLGELQCMLHAALLSDSPSYVLMGRRLACSPSLPPPHRAELEQLYRSVMAGELTVNRSTREATVDLWLEMRRRDGTDPWVADRCDKPYEIFADAGLLWEAVLSAEQALSDGAGNRRELLGRLADMYEVLGDLTNARDHLLSLLAEHQEPERQAQLRRIDDRLNETN
jgi:methylated-DNA-[protein]-cysteine S-methyltransferase